MASAEENFENVFFTLDESNHCLTDLMVLWAGAQALGSALPKKPGVPAWSEGLQVWSASSVSPEAKLRDNRRNSTCFRDNC